MTREDAENNCYEDDDLYSLELGEKGILADLKKDVAEYYL